MAANATERLAARARSFAELAGYVDRAASIGGAGLVAHVAPM